MTARRRRSEEVPGLDPEPPQRAAESAPPPLHANPAAIKALQRSVGNAAVEQMLSRRADTTTPVVQRQPVRPPVRQVPRGRYGQLPGQRPPPRRLTRAEAARREARDRKDREREQLKRAQERLRDMLRKRSIAFVKHWAKHGSEPKTAAQKAFHIVVKILEGWDEVSSGWDKIDKSASNVLDKYAAHRAAMRKSWTTLDDASKQKVHREIQDLERGLVDIYQKIADLEKDFVDRAIAWSIEQEALLDEYSVAVGNPQTLLAQFLELAAHAGKCSQIKTDFDLGRRLIEMDTASLSRRLTREPFVVPPVDLLPAPRMDAR